MKKLLILMLVLGLASTASALPVITGPTEIDISVGFITLTLEGTAAEASKDGGGDPMGGYFGWIWVDYGAYSYQLGAPSDWTANVGGALSTFDTTYLAAGGGFGFTAVSDLTWSEPTDVDSGAWFTFDVSMLGGAIADDTYDVQILDENFGWLSSYTVTVVPEPATIALLGLGSLFLMRRRRK